LRRARLRLSTARRRPTIHLVLSDDWELRGNGSGNMRALQFDTMLRLADTYERVGLRASFNVEVMQQLAHLRLGSQHPQLERLAHQWEDVVQSVYRRGHDIQLHLHPQWSDVQYEDGRFQLRGDWSILNYSATDVRQMVGQGKAYIENLLGSADRPHRCISFRSGAWAVAPSPHLLRILAEQGIVIDMSVVDAMVYRTRNVTVDNRDIDEPFLPYYPEPDDARRVADTRQPLVCVPTHSARGLEPVPTYFRGRIASSPRRPSASLGYYFGARLANLILLLDPNQRSPASPRLARRYRRRPDDTPIPGGDYASDYAEYHWGTRPADKQADETAPAGTAQVTDLAGMTLAEMLESVNNVRRRARSSGWQEVPVIFENHTKDIGNWEPIERFAGILAQSDDIEVLTLTELANRVSEGRYPIRTKDDLAWPG
jgi:hypothetical protein